MDRDNINNPFTIMIDGRFVHSPPAEIGRGGAPAKMGDFPDAAVFTLEDGFLRCGGKVMGRHQHEVMAFRPVSVYWHKDSSTAQKTEAVFQGEDGSITLQSNGTKFGVEPGHDEIQGLFPGMWSGAMPHKLDLKVVYNS